MQSDVVLQMRVKKGIDTFSVYMITTISLASSSSESEHFFFKYIQMSFKEE